MSASRSRRRALGFTALALVCGVLSAKVAVRYREGATPEWGPERPVVVVERELRRGRRMDPGRLQESLAVRSIPERFLPPDALADPGQAAGARLRVTVPAGSYLLSSQLGAPGSREPDRLPPGSRPIEVTVSAAAELAGARDRRVDVVAADQPGTTSNPRVRVLARRVRLLSLARARGRAEEPDRWRATLALTRRQALAVISAENFAREVRLLPRGGGAR